MNSDRAIRLKEEALLVLEQSKYVPSFESGITEYPTYFALDFESETAWMAIQIHKDGRVTYRKETKFQEGTIDTSPFVFRKNLINLLK